MGPDNAVRLDRAARRIAGREVELLVLPEGRHRWLYEDPVYRGRIAAFLARHLAGAPEPDRAAALAVATRVLRPADTDGALSALDRPTAPASPAPVSARMAAPASAPTAAPASAPAAGVPTSSGPDGPT